MEIATDPVAHLLNAQKLINCQTIIMQIMKSGLKSLSAGTLSGTNKWCPKTFGAMLEDSSTHDVTFKTSDCGRVFIYLFLAIRLYSSKAEGL